MRRLRAGVDRSTRTDALPYAVLDLETDGLRGPLAFYTVACQHGHRAEGTSIVELWRLVLSHSGRDHSWRDHVWWAHNGGGYDYLYLLPPARDDVARRDLTVTPISRQDAVIGWKIQQGTAGHRHRTDLRDSFALLTAGLADLAAQLAPELPKLPRPFDDDGRGFDPTIESHRAYARRDSEALLAVLIRFRAILSEQYGVLPGWSAASTALRAWRASLPVGTDYAHPPASAAALARRAYYGGMVRPGRTGWLADQVTVDVNSMYPAVMARGVPDGACWRVERFDPHHPGFYRATVEVPADAPWTPLPYRDPVGVLAWPTGRFTSDLSSLEVRYALDRGWPVIIHEGWVWQGLADPFGPFVERYARLRAMGGAFGTAAKFVGNGLYGKFGSRPTHDDWCLSAERPGRDWWAPAYDASDPAEVEAHRGLWVRRNQPLHADYLMPHWAAWITSAARMELTRLAETVGPAAVAYCDTDSLVIPADRLSALAAELAPADHPTALGKLKIERRWSMFRVHAPKVYEGLLAPADPAVESGSAAAGDARYKAKGIPRRLAAAAFATPGRPVDWASPNGSLRVMQGADMLTDRTRRLSSIAGSLAWREGDDGTVRPVHLGYSPGVLTTGPPGVG